MKKTLVFLAFGLIFSSCTKSISIIPSGNQHTFSICAEMGNLQAEESTKAIGENVIRLKWTAGDKISVVNVTTGKALGGNLTADADGTASLFSGELTGTINAHDKLAFIYPCQNYSAEANFVPVEIDYSVQNATTPALVMIAHHTVDSETGSFENITVNFNFQMSFMRVNMSQLPVSTTINSVQMNGVNDHIQLSISGGEIISTTSANKNFIKYTTPFNTDVRGTNSILMGVLPSPATTSRTITAETATRTYDAYFNNAQLKVNKYYYTLINGFDKITFEDPVVEQYCLDNYDYDHDGKISFAEAASVPSFPGGSPSPVATKASGSPIPNTITSFTELNHFTGLTAYPCFSGYTNLTSVSVPEQITSLPDNCFNGCSALGKVVMYPSTPPTLGNNAFAGTDAVIYVPEESVSSYEEADGWKDQEIEDHTHVDDDKPINIPDANFKAYLVANFDINGDGEISKEEAKVPTSMSFYTDDISSITGIKNFINLTTLAASGSGAIYIGYDTGIGYGNWDGFDIEKEGIQIKGRLLSADLSGMSKLNNLRIEGNILESLNVDNCSQLTSIQVRFNSKLPTVNLSSLSRLTNLIIAYGNATSLDVSKNTALRDFECSYNNISSLNVSHNTALETLYCRGNQLTNIDIGHNLSLTSLDCGSNQLTSIYVSDNTSLTSLNCGYNQLANIDISKNSSLTYINCDSCQLTSIDVSNNPSLTSLVCGYNNLTNIDISKNTKLRTLACYNNQLTNLNVSDKSDLTDLCCSSNNLTSLDVSNNKELETLLCDSNELTNLDVSNNIKLSTLWCNSTLLSSLDISNNPLLYWLKCNDNEQLAELWLENGQTIDRLVKDDHTEIKYKDKQNVEFADANFKAYCVSNFDTDGDGEISKKEALVPTKMTICTDDIYDITGIKSFINLQTIDASGSGAWYKSDVSSSGMGNTEGLDKQREGLQAKGHLQNVDLSGMTQLRYLAINGNNLESLDLTDCINLFSIRTTFCTLTSLDLVSIPNLQHILCNYCLLFNLNVGNNTALIELSCHNNELTCLSVDYCPALEYLHCQKNQLTSLNVCNNRALTTLCCYDNQLTNLNVSNNTMLTELQCGRNPLTNINISNNKELTQLSCCKNQLSNLDIGNNTKLTYIDCGYNQLANVDFSKNIELTRLYCDSNNLRSLDVSKNTALTSLFCSYNQLTNLDVSNNTVLTSLWCIGNPSLTELWLKTGQTINELNKDSHTQIKYKSDTPGAGGNEGIGYENW